MRSYLLAWTLLIGWTHAKEFVVTKNQSDLVFEGHYLIDQNNKGKEFWLCVDYESALFVPEYIQITDYPISECGGSPQTRENMFWYAVHGTYVENDKLKILFKSAFQVWAEYRNMIRPWSSFLWNRNVFGNSDENFKIVQSHGVTNFNQKRPDVDTLLLYGSGSVHVAGVQDGTKIHVRIKNEEETGIKLEKIYEKGPKTEEVVTELPLYSDEKLPELIDSEPVLTGSTTEDTPHLLVRLPEMDEEGIQSRPTENIPFIKPTLISDPVYDGSSEEMRKIEDEKFNKFENEIVEEDVPESTTQLNDETNVPEDGNHLSELLVQDEDSINEHTMLYTIATAATFGCILFFIIMLLLRCYACGRSGKLTFPQNEQKRVVYTIGGFDTPPTKVITE